MPLAVRLVLALLAVYILYFRGLDAVGLLGPDEPRYAAIGTAMAATGDWVTPRLWGAPWFEKPVLLYWMTAAGRLLGLGDELAPRLPVALCGAWFLGVYYRLLRAHIAPQAAFFATLMLGTSAGWLVYSRVAVTDVPLTFCFSTAMLLALDWISDKGSRRLPLVGILLGFGMLAKGLVPAVLSLPLFALRWRQWREWWRVILPSLAVALPWYTLVTLRNGTPFLEEFFLRHHFGRVTTGELQHVQPFWYYIPVLLGLVFPWTPLLVLIRKPGGNPTERFLLAWAAFGILFFSLSTNKLPGYLLPMLPAVCASAGIGLQRAPRPHAALAVGFSLLGIVPVLGQILPDAVASGTRQALDQATWTSVIVAPVLAVAGWLMTRYLGTRAATESLAIGVTAAIFYLQTASFPLLDHGASARGDWRTLAGQADLLCLDAPGRGLRYGLNYYAGREIPDCEENPRPIRWPKRPE